MRRGEGPPRVGVLSRFLPLPSLAWPGLSWSIIHDEYSYSAPQAGNNLLIQKGLAILELSRESTATLTSAPYSLYLACRISN